MRRRRRTLGAVAAAGLVAASVPGATAGAAKATPLTVLRETYVDRSRSTPASELQAAASDRTLETRITFPARARGRLPLVLLAHGSNGNPEKFTQLVESWADAGYVVVAPLFPRSSDVGGNLVRDYPEQPADLSFVLDRVLAANARRRSPLHGRIDHTRIGLAGLSLGGATTYGTVFHSCCHDDRVDAAILMSAVLAPFPNGVYEFWSVPTLLVHGDADNLYPQSVEAFPQLSAPKWFVTLHGGHHANPFEDDRSPSDDVVRAVTTAFWDRYLKGERGAGRRIVDAVAATAGAATLQRDAS